MIALFALLPLLAMATPCADPAIVSARVSATNGTNASLNVYKAAITVRNRGKGAQPSSLLQSIAVYQDGMKVDQIGIKPLAPGASQTVTYRLERAAGARAGTTQLRFALVLRDPHGPVAACSTAGHEYRLAV